MSAILRCRGRAVAPLVVAGATALAAVSLAAPAGAATNHGPAYYQGVTSANVLGVALHLPSALPSVPTLPRDLAANLIGVTGNAVHNSLGAGAKTDSTAVSTLASGSLVDALPSQLGLHQSVRATLSGQSSAEKTDIDVPADPLAHVRVGFLKADVGSRSNTASALLNDGKVGELGQLLDLRAGTGSATILATIQHQLNNSTVSDTVSNVLSTINSALQNAPAGSATSATLSQLQSGVQQIQDKVNAIIANVGNTAVVTFSVLNATQSIAASGDAALARAAVRLANLDVLNGLLTVKGFVSQATASATGVRGGAKASFSGHAPIVAVGTPALTATLDEAGLSLSNLPAGIPAQVTDALDRLQGALNNLLNTLGVKLNYVPGHVDKVDPSGRYAAATGPEYDIVVTNPADNSALAEIGLGHGTAASVSAAKATRFVALPNPQQADLPHTGANLPLIGGVGLALLVGAAVLRRRFT